MPGRCRSSLHVETVGFDYGQRHRIEMDVRLTTLRELRMPFRTGATGSATTMWLILAVLGQISETSLTRDVAIAYEQSGLPNTFVPGRNLLFLTFAATIAYRRGLEVLVGGMCETDFSGYPGLPGQHHEGDAAGAVARLDRKLRVETPLMWIDKAQTWALADQLGGGALTDADCGAHPHLLSRRAWRTARAGAMVGQGVPGPVRDARRHTRSGARGFE